MQAYFHPVSESPFLVRGYFRNPGNALDWFIIKLVLVLVLFFTVFGFCSLHPLWTDFELSVGSWVFYPSLWSLCHGSLFRSSRTQALPALLLPDRSFTTWSCSLIPFFGEFLNEPGWCQLAPAGGLGSVCGLSSVYSLPRALIQTSETMLWILPKARQSSTLAWHSRSPKSSSLTFLSVILHCPLLSNLLSYPFFFTILWLLYWCICLIVASILLNRGPCLLSSYLPP